MKKLITIICGIIIIAGYSLMRYFQKYGFPFVDNNILADALQTAEYGGIGLGVVYVLGKVGKRAISK